MYYSKTRSCFLLKQGAYGRFDFGDIEQDEDFWAMVERATPELWDAIPESAVFSLEAPPRFEPFSDAKGLCEWFKEAREE